MKKFTFLSILISFLLLAGGMQAQLSSSAREQAKNVKVIKPNLNQKGENGIGQLPVNPDVVNRAVLDDPVIITTRYDLQSNASSENRIHLFPDGTVGAVTMMSHDDSFGDRGTGPNLYDGSDWGTPPLTRIETSKAGWPSYAPWGPNGEISVAHHNLDGLFIMTRATKGTGAWTEAILPGPAAAVDISWPRVVTNGPDNMYIHIIATTYSIYQGLDPYALLYYRSLDGGATWDIQHRIIEGMTSADYVGFTSDMYTWAQPHGDTLAFAFCDSWMDLAIMKSYNNGLDWEKVVAWPSQYNLDPITGTVDNFYAPDGTVGLALDKYGKAHVVTGLMWAAADAGSKQWVPKSDGILYWNENMPQLPAVLDWDELITSGNLIGWVTDTNVFYVDDSQIAWYYNSMTSQPTITVDDDDFVFVIWAGVTMNTDPDDYLLRHIYARGSSDYGASWTSSLIDLTSDFLQYTWSECVYASVSWNTDDYLYLVFQEDDYGGVSLNGASGAQGQVAIGNNNIRFLKPSKMDILFPVGTGNEQVHEFNVTQNYPNPVTDITSVKVNLTTPGTLGLEVTSLLGQNVQTISKGSCTAGNYYFTFSTKGLTPGVYFYTVTFNNTKVTKKMIVE